MTFEDLKPPDYHLTHDNVQVAKHFVNDAAATWEPRIPLQETYAEAVIVRLENLLDDLNDVEGLRLDLSYNFINERKKFHFVLRNIITKYIGMAQRLQTNSRDHIMMYSYSVTPANLSKYFVDMGLIAIAFDSIGTGIRYGEMIKLGEITSDEAYQELRDQALAFNTILSHAEDIPREIKQDKDKMARGLAGFLEIANPRTKLGDIKAVRQGLSVGNIPAWKNLYGRSFVGIEYVNAVQKRVGNHRVKISGIDNREMGHDWWEFLCLPRLVKKLSEPEIQKVLLEELVEKNKKGTKEISKSPTIAQEKVEQKSQPEVTLSYIL